MIETRLARSTASSAAATWWIAVAESPSCGSGNSDGASAEAMRSGMVQPRPGRRSDVRPRRRRTRPRATRPRRVASCRGTSRSSRAHRWLWLGTAHSSYLQRQLPVPPATERRSHRCALRPNPTNQRAEPTHGLLVTFQRGTIVTTLLAASRGDAAVKGSHARVSAHATRPARPPNPDSVCGTTALFRPSCVGDAALIGSTQGECGRG